ncbi:MAG: TetR/AcrR family transcriptional regulator [Sellimonas intestinalis]
MSNTKQKILDVSLDLFSRKGFSAVSIRDICAQVND